MDTDNKAINIENDLKHKISILHYSGKFKPWSVRGAVNHNAEFFQEIGFENYWQITFLILGIILFPPFSFCSTFIK